MFLLAHGVDGGHGGHGPAPAPSLDGSIPLHQGLMGAAGGAGDCLVAAAISCPRLLSLLLDDGYAAPGGKMALLLTSISWSLILFAGVRFVSPTPLNSTIVSFCRFLSP